MDWLGRADVVVLALMFLGMLVVLARGLYRCYKAEHQTRTFLRDAANALNNGAFNEASRVAERYSGSPVAVMVATWLATVGTDSDMFDLSKSVGAASRAFWRCQADLNAKFIFGLDTLRSIAHTAPFLGLAGACELILNGALRGFDMEKHAAVLVSTIGTATSLLATVTGLAVATPAAWSYNYLRERTEMLEHEMSQKALDITTQMNVYLGRLSRAENHDSPPPKWHKPSRRSGGFQFAQRQPLRKRFSDMPAYASLAAPVMALAVAAFMIFSSFYVPTGLNVRLLKPPANERQFVPAVVIRSVGTGLDRQSVLYLNAKETSWERLGAEVKGELTINSQSVIYVEAEGDVSWQTVASAIDAIKRVSADVVLVSINLPTGLRGHTNF